MKRIVLLAMMLAALSASAQQRNNVAPSFSGAIEDFHGGITLEGCSIMEPEGGQIKTNTSGVPYRIVDKNGNMAKTVKIVAKSNPADVNRDGTVDSADIVAVIKEMPDGDKKADVNGDKVIDSADIVAVIKAMK